MRRKRHNPLQFDGEGAGVGEVASAEGLIPSAEGVQSAQVTLDTGAETGEAGTTEPTATEAGTPPKEARKTLNDLLKADDELKKEYNELLEGTLKKRLRGYNNLKADNAGYQEAFRLLADIMPDAPREGGTAALLEFLKGKNDIWEDAANQAGMSVETYKKFTETQREAERLRGEQQAQQENAQMEAMFAEWDRQAIEVKKIYPDFDLSTELNNPMFHNAVNSGFSLQQAFEALHHHELMAGAIQMAEQNASKEATKRTVNALRSSQDRPLENGLGGAGGGSHEKKVSELTPEDRARINERVMRGERIVL